jgi:transcriptional regulator with XRE-family HTH domain
MDNIIHKKIREKNMTQIELARIIGIEQTYLNHIINRKVTPTAPLMARISCALEEPAEYLFITDHDY